MLSIVAADANEARAFAREHELPYPVLLGTRELRDDYRVTAFPTNHVVDPEGYVARHTVRLSTRRGLLVRMGLAGR